MLVHVKNRAGPSSEKGLPLVLSKWSEADFTPSDLPEEDIILAVTRLLLPLRPRVSPLLEITDKVQGRVTFAPLSSLEGIDDQAVAQVASDWFWRQSFDASAWQKAVAELARVFRAENLCITVLYEPLTEYLRTVLLDTSDQYRVATHCEYWLRMYEYILDIATATPGTFVFVQIQDIVSTAGACEISLRDIKVSEPRRAVSSGDKSIALLSRVDDTLLQELKPATSTSLDEVEILIRQQMPRDLLAQIARIEACCRRAVYNRRALMLSHNLQYSTSLIRLLNLDFGGEGEPAGGVLVKNPALFDGKPILEFSGRRWLAHAPPPNTGESEFIFPFLLLSGQYQLFMNVVGRDRRARPLNLIVQLISSQTGEIIFKWSEYIKNGRNIFIKKTFSADGEYHLSLSIGVCNESPDNYFSAVWIGDASLMQASAKTCT